MYKLAVQIDGYDGVPETPQERVMTFTTNLMGKLIHDNFRCFQALTELGIPPEDIEMELWAKVAHAANLFDERRVDVKFTTYAWNACERRLFELYRNKQAAMRKAAKVVQSQELSLMKDSEDDSQKLPKALTLSGINVDRAAINEALESLRKNAKDQKRFDIFVEMLLDGETQVEIAKALGLSQPSISSMLKKLRLGLREVLEVA